VDRDPDPVGSASFCRIRIHPGPADTDLFKANVELNYMFFQNTCVDPATGKNLKALSSVLWIWIRIRSDRHHFAGSTSIQCLPIRIHFNQT
jgi:hypothetical protein